MSECCICHKQLEDWQTFGPLRYPVCQSHYWEYGERLDEIDAIGSHHSHTLDRDLAFAELVAGIYMPKEQQKIADLEKEIKGWQEEVDFHRDEICHYEDLIASNRRKIRDLKKQMAKAPAPDDKEAA